MENETILIIDDEQSFLDISTDTLENKNFNVLQALNGEMGLEVANKFLPDIVIVDWDMPAMDGIETIKQLKKQALTRDIPVILATGKMTSSENLETALSAGAVDYIRKPVDTIELTARINSALKISKYIKEVANQRDKLKELNVTKDKFFSIIAHDLKNPFNIILGFSDLLLKNIQKYDIQKTMNLLSTIKTTSKQGFELLENLLIWAGSQTGRIAFRPELIDLKACILQNISNIKSQALEKSIKITVSDFEPCMMFGDKNMINTILRNLMSNAIKFTYICGQIHVNLINHGDHYEISLKDSGIGISKENINKLFQLDSKFRANGTSDEKGTGLGLILCKEFVEKHGGKIWVESEINKGSEFKFTLPK
jgi:signal transduction histidine kinase